MLSPLGVCHGVRWSLLPLLFRASSATGPIGKKASRWAYSSWVKCPEKYRPLMVTAMFTGMRISELRGLTWDYVDLDMKLIVVCERADRFNDLGKTKSRTSRRSIPMAPIVIETLKAWKPDCPAGDLTLVFPKGRATSRTTRTSRTASSCRRCRERDRRRARGVQVQLPRPASRGGVAVHRAERAAEEDPGAARAFVDQHDDGCQRPPFESPEDDVELFSEMEKDLLAALLTC